jgi:PAS domain S-box-containing protein
METSSDKPGSLRKYAFATAHAISIAAAIAVSFLGGLGIIGWAFGITLFKSVLPGLASMKANAAISLTLLGAAILLLSREQGSRGRRYAGRALVGISLFLGLATLVEYASGRRIGIDQLIFHDLLTPGKLDPGRMSPLTALSILLLGTSLLMLDSPQPKLRTLSQNLALLSGSIGLVGIFGYLYSGTFDGPLHSFTSMALNTAFAIALEALALLCLRPRESPISLLLSSGPGGTIARVLLPFSIAAPIVLGWTGLVAERSGYFGPDITLGTMAILLMAASAIAILSSARALDSSDDARRLAEAGVRDAAEQARSDKRSRELLEAAPVAMVVVNQDGEIVLLNLQAEIQFGYARRELLGQQVKTIIPEGFAERLISDGSQIAAPDLGDQIDIGTELLARRKDGGYFPIEMMLSPLEDSDGVLITAAIRNITDLKQAEKERLQTIEELKRSNEELGQFAYIASHDLQEPLRMVASYTQLLSKRYRGKLDSDADDFIDFAVDGATRMQRLIQDLLTYSRVGTMGIAPVDTWSEVALLQAISNLDKEIQEGGATVTFDPLPMVLADETQLVQLFQNLIGNGIKYHVGKGAKVHVSAVGRADGNWTFSVNDNGLGIDPQYFERIFGMFQRLHKREEFEGTGIGLAICKKIVLRHKGRIWVESEPGHGSTFCFEMAGSGGEFERLR